MFTVTTKGMATGLAAILLELKVIVTNLCGTKKESITSSAQ